MAAIRRRWLFSSLLKITLAINSAKLSCSVLVSGRLFLTSVSGAVRGVTDRTVLICLSGGNAHLCSGGDVWLIQLLARRENFIHGDERFGFHTYKERFSKSRA